jgi:hypothetical protein
MGDFGDSANQVLVLRNHVVLSEAEIFVPFLSKGMRDSLLKLTD